VISLGLHMWAPRHERDLCRAFLYLHYPHRGAAVLERHGDSTKFPFLSSAVLSVFPFVSRCVLSNADSPVERGADRCHIDGTRIAEILKRSRSESQ
jgi:hypothetical protein